MFTISNLQLAWVSCRPKTGRRQLVVFLVAFLNGLHFFSSLTHHGPASPSVIASTTAASDTAAAATNVCINTMKVKGLVPTHTTRTTVSFQNASVENNTTASKKNTYHHYIIGFRQCFVSFLLGRKDFQFNLPLFGGPIGQNGPTRHNGRHRYDQ